MRPVWKVMFRAGCIIFSHEHSPGRYDTAHWSALMNAGQAVSVRVQTPMSVFYAVSLLCLGIH